MKNSRMKCPKPVKAVLYYSRAKDDLRVKVIFDDGKTKSVDVEIQESPRAIIDVTVEALQ